MPIRRELRKFYGPEWKQTRARILERAKWKCEQCGKRDRSIIYTVTEVVDVSPTDRRYYMFWREEGGTVWMDQSGIGFPKLEPVRIWRVLNIRRIRVVLTVAHLNHKAGDDRDNNLRAYCQWCHLHHDQVHHAETRKTRKDSRRPLLAVGEEAAV